MRAGDLDRRVTLLRPAAAVDDGYTTRPGGHEEAGERWARHMPAMAREIIEASGREAKLPIVLELRHDSLTRLIDGTWRVRMDGRTYDVEGAQEIGRREGVRLSAVAGDDEG